MRAARALALGVIAGIAFFACASAKQGAADATYLGQQLSCVDRASTLEESKACRARVQADWGRGPADGGADHGD